MTQHTIFRFLAGAAVALAGATTCLRPVSALAQGSGGPVTEYALPPVVGDQQGSFEPWGVTAGADGAVWFSDGDAIGRITPGGAVRQYPIPTHSSGTGWMHLGPDRAVWFAERNVGKIGRITVSGQVTEYPIPSGPDSIPQGITTGPDGALWITEQGSNVIARLTLAGQFSEYAVPTPNAGPLGITSGPDGALWFTERSAGKVGRMTLDGHFTEYSLSAGAGVQRITVGPDGALWFSELRASKIGRITLDGHYSEYPVPHGPVGITMGPDGALWYAAYSADAIGRMTTDGHVTEYPVGTAGSGPLQIAVGPDAALWSPETQANQIARLQIPGVHGRGQLLATDEPWPSASFTVSFSSSAPGQGYVLFGSGPGCAGLVGVGTQDARSGTAQHAVTVNGNDLQGMVGAMPILPGATYWYETETVTASGTEIDNNAGTCYSVTVPGT